MLRKTVAQFPHARPYLIVTAISLALFFPTWLRLVDEWLKWEQVLTHGLPTFFIYLGLLLIHPPLPGKPGMGGVSVTGGIALLVVTLIWVLLELVRIDTLAYLMLPPGVAATAWALLGFRAMLAFLPHVLLLGLSLPFWADLVPGLVSLASVVVGNLVGSLGMPALIEGSSITLPYGRLVIADGCSGIRYFAVSILLAAMTAILNDYRWKGWAAALAIAIALALLVNWIRITALVIIAHQSDMQSSLMDDHEMFGWLIYAAFVVPAMWLVPVARRNNRPGGAPPAMTRKSFGFVIAAALIGPLGITLAHSAASTSPSWVVTAENITEASSPTLPLTMSLPENLEHRVWRAPGTTRAWISVAQSRKQSADDKLVPYLPRSVDRDNWFLEEQHQNGQVQVYRHITSRKQVAFSQWYQVGSYRTDDYTSAKLLQIPATLKGQNRFALVTLQAECGPRECESAVNRLGELTRSLRLETPR